MAPHVHPQSQNIDLIKLTACLLVITVHITGVNLVDIASPEWTITNVYESFSRVCVPLFFMVSGATLLPRNHSLGEFLKRRFLRIFPPLLFWSFVYIGYYYYSKGWDLRAWGAYYSFVLWKPSATHLWYLYALIGIYPFIPLISKIYNNSSDTEKIYFLALWFVISTVVPFLGSAYSIRPNLSVYYLQTIGGYIGYFFLGAFAMEIGRRPHRSIPWISAAIYVLSSMLIAVMTYRFSMAVGKWITVFQAYLTPLVAVGALGLFTLLMSLRLHLTELQGRALASFAQCSLGVYCIHIIVRDELARVDITAAHSPYTLMVPAVAMLVMGISWLAIFIARKVPALRYIL
jgi:surface polysaccharide O-acyltransferase-like enzyme